MNDVLLKQDVTIGDKRFALNPEGYLKFFAVRLKPWADYCARKIGYEEGISHEQQVVVDTVRTYYSLNDEAPTLEKIIAETGFKITHIYELFPNAVVDIPMMAGLPGPLPE